MNCPNHPNRSMTEYNGQWTCSEKIGLGQPGANKNGYCAVRIPIAQGAGSPAAAPASNGSSRGWQPKSETEQRSIAAQAAFKASCHFHATRGTATPEEIGALAKRGFDFIMRMASGSPSPRPAPVQQAPPPPEEYPFPGDPDDPEGLGF